MYLYLLLMVNTIYVVRHGLRADDEPSPTNIDGDPKLNIHGEEQAEEVGKYLAQQLPDTTQLTLFASPYYRCCQTATAISHHLNNLKINVESGIGESYSKQRPKKPQPAPLQEVAKFFPLIDTAYKSQVSVDVNGESRADLRARLFKAMQHILKVCPTETLIIVTHAAGKIELGAVLAGKATDPAATCSLDKYVYSDSEGCFKCTVNNDTQYLSGGAQNIWGFKDPEPLESECFSEELVQLDFSSAGVQLGAINPSEITLARLDTDRPVIKIKDKLFEGRWQDVVGTELFTSTKGEAQGVSRKRIKLISAEEDERSLKSLLKLDT